MTLRTVTSPSLPSRTSNEKNQPRVPGAEIQQVNNSPANFCLTN